MKKILVLIITSFLLISCSKNSDELKDLVPSSKDLGITLTEFDSHVQTVLAPEINKNNDPLKHIVIDKSKWSYDLEPDFELISVANDDNLTNIVLKSKFDINEFLSEDESITKKLGGSMGLYLSLIMKSVHSKFSSDELITINDTLTKRFLDFDIENYSKIPSEFSSNTLFYGGYVYKGFMYTSKYDVVDSNTVHFTMEISAPKSDSDEKFLAYLDSHKKPLDEQTDTPQEEESENVDSNQLDTSNPDNNVTNTTPNNSNDTPTSKPVEKPTQKPSEKPIDKPTETTPPGMKLFKNYGSFEACNAVINDELWNHETTWKSNFCMDDGRMFYTPYNETEKPVGKPVEKPTEKPVEKPVEKPSETESQRNAYNSAKNYLSFTSFSFSGLVKQLEFEGYSNADAQYAVTKTNTDWNKQAVKTANNYLSLQGFSMKGLISQLEYEGFTNAQAKHGVGKTNADWNKQAERVAQAYMNISSFSRDSLINQLIYEGFTRDQAVHGTNSVGL